MARTPFEDKSEFGAERCVLSFTTRAKSPSIGHFFVLEHLGTDHDKVVPY